MLTGKEQSLLDALMPLAEEQGIEIVTLEIVGAKKSPTIRVYIDTEHGVGFDELSSAQSWINDIMDQIDPFPGAYMLEVSSPGIDRPLRTLEHFRRFRGSTAVIKTVSPVEGRSNFTGVIEEVTDDTITLTCENASYAIPFKTIKKANIKGTVDFNR